MKYTFRVLKETRILSNLTVACEADSYEEAVAKFNKHIDKISEAKYKEIETTTKYKVRGSLPPF